MATTEKQVEISMVSKIVPKTLGNPKAGASVKDGETFLLGRVYGITDGIKQVEIKETGEIFQALRGRFQAVSADETKQYRSGLLYLPGGIHDSYLSGVKDLQEGETLQFALELRTKPATSKAGYAYDAIDLMPRLVADPMDLFIDSVKQGKALTNPTKQAILGTGETPKKR